MGFSVSGLVGALSVAVLLSLTGAGHAQTTDAPDRTEQQTDVPGEGTVPGTPPGEGTGEVTGDTTGDAGEGLIGPPAPGPEDLTPENAEMAAWASLATRAETALTEGVASEFALNRLRAQIVQWRDRFLAEEGENAERIATVTAQIAALGAAPEDGTAEEPRIASRRAELTAQLTKLRAPQRLAQEAFAHAAGLTSEIDAVLREQRTRALFVRGASPLDPGLWRQAVIDLGSRVSTLMNELRTSLGSAARWETFYSNLPGILLLLVAGFVLLHRNQRRARRILARLEAEAWRGAGVWRLVVSFGQVGLPLVGLVCIETALKITGLFGIRASAIIEVFAIAGANVIIARWLAAQFFAPERAEASSMDIAPENRARIRRLIEGLGWLIAATVFLEAALEGTDMSSSSLLIVRFPLQVLVALVLFRLGRQFAKARPKRSDNDGVRFRSGALPLFGRVLTVVAALGPLLSGVGYTRAWDALIAPSILTLALLGAVIVLQRLVYDVYSLVLGDKRRGEDALLPVLLGFVIIMVAVPVLAMIWGVRSQELAEIWARFREGYSWGETRISPTDFVTFAVVFGIVYAITKGIQGALRTTILPRTALDPGARNAIVAGVGYVGIFVAAIAAITSAGINLSSLAIVAGALSVGIGFGLQNIVSNFVSGIILLIERPISEGDWIEVGTQMGYVRAISVRSTRIETFDRTDVIIPNADLVSGTVTNWTRMNSVGRVKVPVGVAYGTDTARVTAILREIAENNPMVLLDPPPNVFFLRFGADSLDFEIRAILRDVNFVMVVASEMNHEIARRFAEEGIEIPFAQRDIWLRNPEVLHGAQPPGSPPPRETAALAGQERQDAATGNTSEGETEEGQPPAKMRRRTARPTTPIDDWTDPTETGDDG